MPDAQEKCDFCISQEPRHTKVFNDYSDWARTSGLYPVKIEGKKIS
jgi:hypothetical protein